MFVPNILTKKNYKFNNIKPTLYFFKMYSYNLKTLSTNNNNIIPKVYKKDLVKLI